MVSERFCNRPLKSIKKTTDFKEVYKHGKVVSNRFFAAHVNPNGSGQTRLGLSISKKVGKAVIRNKLRPRIKEFFRLNKHKISGVDIVIVAKSAAIEFAIAGKFGDVSKNIANLLDLMVEK